jgi:hypothetical protein
LLLCLFEQIRSHPGFPKKAACVRPARSVFGTRRTSTQAPSPESRAASPCQLVNVLPVKQGKHPASPKKTSSPTSPEAARTTSGVALLRARRAYRTAGAPVKGQRPQGLSSARPHPETPQLRPVSPGAGGRFRTLSEEPHYCITAEPLCQVSRRPIRNWAPPHGHGFLRAGRERYSVLGSMSSTTGE